MIAFEKIKKELLDKQYIWLITGVAGFIGSHLLEALLLLNQKVVGIDNLSTGKISNFETVQKIVSATQWGNFKFYKADICNLPDCQPVFLNIDYVLHQAALGSVPRSIEDPIATNASNVTGFLNVLVASRNVNVKRFVYAASSSTYGDHPILPKVEERIGKPLSPYAITKYINELYAEIFSSTYALQSIGLRYFNVFGPRQDSKGAYAAVIPKWVESMMEDEEVYINGNGETTRDFCYIENVVQANLIAARTLDLSAVNQIYNVAYGEETSLNDVYIQIKKNLIHTFPNLANAKPVYRDFRKGDVLQSLACIKKAREKLGYEPSYNLRKGLELTVDWYLKNRLN